jgi:hypothetical protein
MAQVVALVRVTWLMAVETMTTAVPVAVLLVKKFTGIRSAFLRGSNSV